MRAEMAKQEEGEEEEKKEMSVVYPFGHSREPPPRSFNGKSQAFLRGNLVLKKVVP